MEIKMSKKRENFQDDDKNVPTSQYIIKLVKKPEIGHLFYLFNYFEHEITKLDEEHENKLKILEKKNQEIENKNKELENNFESIKKEFEEFKKNKEKLKEKETEIEINTSKEPKNNKKRKFEEKKENENENEKKYISVIELQNFNINGLSQIRQKKIKRYEDDENQGNWKNIHCKKNL